MTHDLFRAEALQARVGPRWGRPVGLLPLAWSRITLLLCAFVLILLIFLATASFSRKETVRGRLKPNTVEAQVFSIDAGTVKKLHVSLGDTVSAGQVVADISTLRLIDATTDLSSETIGILAREKSALADRRIALDAAAQLTRQKLHLTIEAAKVEQQSLRAARELTARRIEIAQARLDAANRLEAEGAGSKDEARGREEQLIVQRQQLNELDTRLRMAVESERGAIIDLGRLDQEVARDFTDIDQMLAQLDGQEARTRAERGFAVKAPVSGQVAALQVAEGERTDPTRPMMTILPQDARLLAEVYVPSRAIAFVEPGQLVRLQYDALPYQKFGAAKGTILSVSQTSFSPEQLRASMQIKEPVYRVTVGLEKQNMPAFGRAVSLQTGMELSADIVLERRKLFEWLLEPLFAASLRMQDPT